jgi:hypothetical protein
MTDGQYLSRHVTNNSTSRADAKTSHNDNPGISELKAITRQGKKWFHAALALEAKGRNPFFSFWETMVDQDSNRNRPIIFETVVSDRRAHSNQGVGDDVYGHIWRGKTEYNISRSYVSSTIVGKSCLRFERYSFEKCSVVVYQGWLDSLGSSLWKALCH